MFVAHRENRRRLFAVRNSSINKIVSIRRRFVSDGKRGGRRSRKKYMPGGVAHVATTPYGISSTRHTEYQQRRSRVAPTWDLFALKWNSASIHHSNLLRPRAGTWRPLPRSGTLSNDHHVTLRLTRWSCVETKGCEKR